MLGKYEKRRFKNNEKIWFGTYKNLTNILHWHPECELIRIAKGTAQIKIGNELFDAKEGDCFFCSAETMHYIVSESETLIDIMIFHKDLLDTITHKYNLSCAGISNGNTISDYALRIRQITSLKPRFYSETLENCARDILLDIYNNNEIYPRQNKTLTDKQLIDKIHSEFSTITFAEIVTFSGYSPSHFSKIFKKLTGMTFSDYLNHVKTEHAVALLQNSTELNITDICSLCGFSTIRNFNRIFKQITGFAPRNLPDDFVTDLNINVYDNDSFDPTSKTSVLI